MSFFNDPYRLWFACSVLSFFAVIIFMMVATVFVTVPGLAEKYPSLTDTFMNAGVKSLGPMPVPKEKMAMWAWGTVMVAVFAAFPLGLAAFIGVWMTVQVPLVMVPVWLLFGCLMGGIAILSNL